MNDKNNSGAEQDTPSFDDAVGKEQPVNAIPSGTSTEEKPDKKPDANGDKPEDQSGVSQTIRAKVPRTKTKSPRATRPSGASSRARMMLNAPTTKPRPRLSIKAKRLTISKPQPRKTNNFSRVLDKALTKNPQLAEQLKASLAEAMKASDAEPEDQPDIDTLLDKKLEERETKAKTKTEIDKWISEHEDFKTPDIGHQVLDLIEKEKLPFNARTLQLAYDSVTKDSQTKKAADEALKKEEVKNLERENASGVGGGQPANKGKTSEESPFDDLVGSSINPNRVR